VLLLSFLSPSHGQQQEQKPELAGALQPAAFSFVAFMFQLSTNLPLRPVLTTSRARPGGRTFSPMGKYSPLHSLPGWTHSTL
jgi:hypothetical protein